MAEQNLSSSLNAAYDRAQQSETPPGTPPPPGPAPTPAPEQTPSTPGSPPPAQGYLAGRPAQTPAAGDPPPRSWRADMRERWGTVPKEVQSEILRRENEISTGLQRAAEARKFQEQFQTMIQPYQAYFAMDGMSPLDGFNEYLRATALVRSGTPQQKAHAIASIVSAFGIDINLLDQFLESAIRGQPVQVPQGGGPQVLRDPRVDHILTQLQQTQESSLGQEIATFERDPKNEFFQDVREDMADILELAANRGQAMTMQEAYQRACELHPNIRAAMEQRRVTEARRSASSLRPASAPPAGANPTGAVSLRDSLNAAISQHST